HKGASLSKAWGERLKANPQKNEFVNFIQTKLTPEFTGAIAALKKDFVEKKPTQATRKSSGDVLEKIVPELSFLIGGSADLTPSNNTRTSTMTDIKPGDFSGRYVRYGVREHGMACIMNGLSLHGGIVPYGGTFMSF